ncbi:MAG: hypothetical protein V3U03_12225 [Myxococcota bacterium]
MRSSTTIESLFIASALALALGGGAWADSHEAGEKQEAPPVEAAPPADGAEEAAPEKEADAEEKKTEPEANPQQ